MENEKERKLSPAEEKRRVIFEKTKEEFAQKGYTEKDMTIGVVYANVMAVLLALPFAVLFGVLFLVLRENAVGEILSLLEMNIIILLVLFIVIMAVLTVAHELIHGITWSFFAKKGFKAISFGYIAEYMTPYCTCDEPFGKTQYITGVLMPTIVLGIIPMTISLFTGSAALLAIGALMVFAGGGDLTIALKLLGFSPEGKEALYIDHPYDVGLVAFIK